MDMRTVGDKTHSHDSNCIYSIANLIGTLSSSLCQMLIKEQLALFQLRSWLTDTFAEPRTEALIIVVSKILAI